MDKKDVEAFDKLVESLRKYRRYELTDDNNRDLLNKIYVDPVDDDGILKLCLKDNTTVLVGRKGTGKSTILMRLQNELRGHSDIMTCYIDVKNVFDKAKQNYTTIQYLGCNNKNEIETYSLQRRFIMDFLNELIAEINKNYDGIWEKIKARLKQSGPQKAIERLNEIKRKIANNDHLEDIEMQTLQSINLLDTNSEQSKEKINTDFNAKITPYDLKVGIDLEEKDTKGYSTEIEKKYTRVFARIFEISNVIEEVKEVLKELSLKRLFLILDDYSEIDQKALSMFCDLIVNCLNNNSDNFIKLKISAYPGRVELGELDRQKIDIRYLDYYQLYANDKRSEMEKSAIDYTSRIIKKRLEVYTDHDFKYYFDTDKNSEEEFFQVIFQMSLNVIRHIGLILDYAQEYSIIHGSKISMTNLQEASKRFYNERLQLFFEESKSAQMAYNERVEIFQLKNLFNLIVNREKEIKSEIRTNKYEAIIFDTCRNNPYCSHFYLAKEYEDMLNTLELNFFVSKYNEMSNKAGKKVSIYALNYGLCLNENLRWGKPAGSNNRTYFIETPFNFNSIITGFMKETKRIVCKKCGKTFNQEMLPFLQQFNMDCPICKMTNCIVEEKVISDSDKLQIQEIQDRGNLLEKEQFTFIKLAILKGGEVSASDMAQELDTTVQKIGWLTKKLEEDYYYLSKKKKGGKIHYYITELARKNLL